MRCALKSGEEVRQRPNTERGGLRKGLVHLSGVQSGSLNGKLRSFLTTWQI